MKKRYLPVITVVAVSLGLAGCAPSGPAETDETYDVLLVAGLTGPVATTAGVYKYTLEQSADYINENGGVNGRQVVVTAVDSQEDPSKANTLIQDALDGDNPPEAVLNGVTSTNALATLPALTRAGVLTFNGASSDDLNKPSEYPTYFGFLPTSGTQVGIILGLLEDEGVESLGVITSSDAFGTAFDAAFKAQASDHGITIIDSQFANDEVDLSAAYSKVATQNPDVIFFNTLGPAAARLFEARLKVDAVDIPAIGGNGITSTGAGPTSFAPEGSLENYRSAVYTAQTIDPDSGDATFGLKEFYSAWTAGTLPEGATTQPAQPLWNALVAIKTAADAKGSTETQDIIDGIQDLTTTDESLWTSLGVIDDFSADVRYLQLQPDAIQLVEPVPLNEVGSFF
jgi:branched-chain amino acid transport system substrate-binding protein